MKSNRIKLALLGIVLFSAAGAIAAAEPDKPAGAMMGDHGSMMSGGMMNGGGMMGMMRGCQAMMGGASGDALAVPKLPPGNEKLELQMRAEMMQKMGEIAGRYAGQIETKGGR
jgi:hypothetical protein